MNRPSFLATPQHEGNRGIVAAIGYLAFAAALVVAFVPLPANPLTSALHVIFGSPVIVIVAGLIGGAYGLFQLYHLGNAVTERPPVVSRAPERAHYRVERIAGEDLDGSVENVGGELPDASARNWWTHREKADVSKTLTTVAVDVLASEFDVGREAAARMIETGSWTDDPRAAAFLGGDDAAHLSLRMQFVDWLSGSAYERRVGATVDAIARHAGLTEADDPEQERAEGDALRSRTAAGAALPVHEAEPNDSKGETAFESDDSDRDSGDRDDGDRDDGDHDGGDHDGGEPDDSSTETTATGSMDSAVVTEGRVITDGDGDGDSDAVADSSQGWSG